MPGLGPTPVSVGPVANKRDQSKQKRARENRAQRAAREARAKAAAVPLDERVAAKAPSREAPSATSSKRGAKGRSGRPERAPVERAPRPGTIPVDLDTLEGSWFSKVNQVPGGREVLMTVLLTGIMTVMVAMTPLFVPDGSPEKAKPSLTIFDTLGATAIPLLAVPLVIVGVAAFATLHERRRQVWTGAMVAMFVFVLAVPSIGMFYLFPAGFLAWARFRAAKVEGPGTPLFRRSRAAADGEGAADQAAGDSSISA